MCIMAIILNYWSKIFLKIEAIINTIRHSASVSVFSASLCRTHALANDVDREYCPRLCPSRVEEGTLLSSAAGAAWIRFCQCLEDSKGTSGPPLTL